MKAFDFDNTIYRGESSIDLAVYMIRNNKKIIFFLPMIFTNLVKYKLCMIGREEMEIILNDFCQAVMGDKDDVPKIIEKFWQTYYCRAGYIDQWNQEPAAHGSYHQLGSGPGQRQIHLLKL